MNGKYFQRAGLFLCGGGFRTGSFEVGAALAFQKAGLSFQYYQGVSVGALNAAKLVESSAKSLKDIWLTIEKKGPNILFNNYRVPLHLLGKSLYSNKSSVRLIDSLDVKTIIQAQERLDIITYNESLETVEVFSNRDNINEEILKKALLASISVPGVLDPVQIGNHWYSDGLCCLAKIPDGLELDILFVVTCDKPSSMINEKWKIRVSLSFERLYEVLVEKLVRELQATNKTKIIVVRPTLKIPTLTFRSFKKGDITAYIDHGFEETNKILNAL